MGEDFVNTIESCYMHWANSGNSKPTNNVIMIMIENSKYRSRDGDKIILSQIFQNLLSGQSLPGSPQIIGHITSHMGVADEE